MIPVVYVERSRIGKASGHEQEAYAEQARGKRLCGSGFPHRG